MACGCRKKQTFDFIWTSDDGTQTAAYTQEIQAKAKVIRSGGAYEIKAK